MCAFITHRKSAADVFCLCDSISKARIFRMANSYTFITKITVIGIFFKAWLLES